MDTRKVAAARLWAAHRYPYLASALFASPVISTEGVQGASADSRWRISIDPAVVDAWSVEQIGSVFVHLSGHLLRSHAERAEAAGVTDEVKGRWTDAADAEVNDDFGDGLVFPAQPVLPGHLGCEEGGLAEEYFRSGQERTEPCWVCGSSAHGRPEAWEGTDGAEEDGEDNPADKPSGLDAEAKRLLRRKVASDVLAEARRAGDVPAGLARWATDLVGGRVDWRRALAAELRRGVSEVSGRVDYSYSRPSRRAGSTPGVILPSLRRPVPDVAVVCDTSASMSNEMLGDALSEVDGLLRSIGVGPGTVRVLSCDTAAHSAQRVRSASQIQLLGGGGTDMGVGLEAAAALRPRPGVIVVLTDGETPWPAGPPKGIAVVVALLGTRAPAPPSWARMVRVDE